MEFYNIFEPIWLFIFYGLIITWSLRFILWVLRGCTNNVYKVNSSKEEKELKKLIQELKNK